MTDKKNNGFKPGHTLSKGYGRPLGSKNKKATIQERLTQFLLGNVADLQREYDRDMTTGQKIRLFEVLLPFASPKLQANSVSMYEKVDEDTLDQMIEGVTAKLIKNKETQQIKANEQIEEANQD